MLTNTEIAQQIELMSKLMEIHGENSFKAKNYAFNATIIKKLPTPLINKEIVLAQDQIGDSVKKSIIELIENGSIEYLETLLDKTPIGLTDLLKIKGLGPKKVALLWKEHDIKNLELLESACLENRLITLKGFGLKTQEQILDQIAFIKNNDGWCLWIDGEKWATEIQQWYNDQFGHSSNLIDFVGAFAMQDPIINGLECVITVPMDVLENALMEAFGDQYIYENDAVSLTIINSQHIACTFMYVSKQEFYNKSFILSSSHNFIEKFNQIAQLPTSVSSLQEIFEFNKLPFIPSYLRHDASILEHFLENKSLPKVIDQESIKGLIHCHSNYSDGLNSIKEMAVAAMSLGLEYMLITDHSKTAAYANGLSVEAIRKQHAEVDKLNIEFAPFKIFKGIESDILADGSLDYDDDVLVSFDLVIASVHSNLNMTKEKATERILRAINNPYTSILGHPTGRLLLARKGYELDMDLIIDACKKNNVAIELNANPKRLDVDWQYLPAMQKAGVLTSINPDAHSTAQISLIIYGILVGQKSALTASNNLSSWNLSEFENYILSQKEKRK